MKAWCVKEKDEFSCAVVFADTRGKARSMAQKTECCEDSNFCDILVRRVPEIDRYYSEGKKEMNWFDKNDRIALVKECGFYCEEVCPDYCRICPAQEYCDEYKDSLDYGDKNG